MDAKYGHDDSFHLQDLQGAELEQKFLNMSAGIGDNFSSVFGAVEGDTGSEKKSDLESIDGHDNIKPSQPLDIS